MKLNQSIIIIAFVLGSIPLWGIDKNRASTSHKATNHLIAFFDSLVSKNIIDVDNLKLICSEDCLVNPITQEDAHSSNTHFVYWTQINQFIEKHDHDLFNVDHIKEWAADKVRDIEARQAVSQEIHEITRDVHRPMQFVELPAGKYVSSLDNAEFEIPEGIEIQDTPVTQWQWIQYMKNNPSQYNDGRDVERITIDDETSMPEQISILGDHPTESVSFGEIEEFIKYLNDNDPIYSYALPSIKEYEALLLASLGNRWFELLKARSSAMEQQTLPVTSTPYLELSNKRVWSVGENVWEFTRDRIVNDIPGHLVFGGSFETQKNSLPSVSSYLRPVLFSDSTSEHIGFRLVRTKKRNFIFRFYSPTLFEWNKMTPQDDGAWLWHEPENVLMLRDDVFRFIAYYKEKQSPDVQVTLNALIQNAKDQFSQDRLCKDNPIPCIKNSGFLSLPQGQIKDLSPIGLLSSLVSVSVFNQKITDVSPLSSLNRLKVLNLNDNEITNISTLEQLINLEQVSLSNNHIIDISPLGQLPHLAMLELVNNPIKTVPPSAQFHALKGLNLSHCELVDCKSVAHLSSLTSLNLSGNAITDIKELDYLTNLRMLELQACCIVDLCALNLPNLLFVSIDGNEIHDISALSSLINIPGLSLSNNQISDITPLAKLQNLEFVDLSYNPITDLSPLKELPHLERIKLDPEQIIRLKPTEILGSRVDIIESTNIIGRTQVRITKSSDEITDVVRNFKDLVSLELQENGITNVSDLSHCKKLEHLNLNHNSVSDISPLATLVSLKELYLEHNRIGDLIGFTPLISLTHLGLAHNKITSLETLVSLKGLESLSIHNNPLNDISDLAKIENLKEVYLDTDQIERFKPHTWLNPNIKIIEVQSQHDPLAEFFAHKESQPEDVQKTIDALTHRLVEQGLTELHPHDFSHILRDREFLDLSESQVRDLTPISYLEKLDGLSLGNNEIKDLSPISKLTHLYDLGLDSNQIADIGSLQGLTELRTLRLNNNKITDIDPVKNLTSLGELDISKNQIIDLSPCSHLTQLYELSAADNQIRDVSPIQNLAGLIQLNLSDNQITDISPLAHVKNLQFINLAHNPIKDLSPLAQLKDLEKIILDDAQIELLKPHEILGPHVEIRVDALFMRDSPDSDDETENDDDVEDKGAFENDSLISDSETEESYDDENEV